MEKEMPNRIREWREARGLTQKQLGALAGCSHAQICDLEYGKRRLSVDWMKKLGFALQVPAGQFLLWHENPQSITPEEWSLIERFRAATDKQRWQLLEIAKIICEPQA